MLRPFHIKELASIALQEETSAESASNVERVATMMRLLSYAGYMDDVGSCIRLTAQQEGFNELSFGECMRRVEDGLKTAGHTVAATPRLTVQGRVMYQNAIDGVYTDIALKAFDDSNGWVVFPAHRCILASASPFFSALIERNHHPTLPFSGDDAYALHGISADALSICMEFIYTGEVRRDISTEPGLLARVVLAADMMVISSGLFPLVGRELLAKANALCVIEAACTAGASDHTRTLIEECAALIVRNADIIDPAAFSCASFPIDAAYAIASELVDNPHAEGATRDARLARVYAALRARYGTSSTGELQAHLIEYGPPRNEHNMWWSREFESIVAINAPPEPWHGSVLLDGVYCRMFQIGKCRYALLVLKARPPRSARSKTRAPVPRDAGARGVTVTVILRSRTESEDSPAPQLVTLSAAGCSTRAVLSAGCSLSVQSADLDGAICVVVNADPVFHVCTEMAALEIKPNIASQ
jgi:hypothetical protein